MKKKICILTQSHLCRNPRVVKEALALDECGFDVVILTTFTYPGMLEEDMLLLRGSNVRLKAAVNMIPSEASSFYRFRERFRRRIAGEAVAKTGWQNVHSLGYDYQRNFRGAINEKADLYICHQEISTVLGCRLMKLGYKTAFDIEDWYSHDLLPEANRTRPLGLLEWAEKTALRESPLVYTTSRALASELSVFAVSPAPVVILNVFPYADRAEMDKLVKDRKDPSRTSVHWFSQTVGPGRGLEFLVETLAQVEIPMELHFRGNLLPGFDRELLSRLPDHIGHSMYFHPLVPHRELLSRIAEHDIGLATEENLPPSRDLTITNKILQYILGGIAVVASDTKGQQEVASEAEGAVFLYKNRDAGSLVSAISALAGSGEKLAAAKHAALESARKKFCWEQQKAKLTDRVRNLLMDK